MRIANEDGGRAETYYVILCVRCTQKSTELLLFTADLHCVGLSPAPQEQPSIFALTFQSPCSGLVCSPELLFSLLREREAQKHSTTY